MDYNGEMELKEMDWKNLVHRWWGPLVTYLLASVLNLSQKQSTIAVYVLLTVCAIWTWLAIIGLRRISILRPRWRLSAKILAAILIILVDWVSIRFFTATSKTYQEQAALNFVPSVGVIYEGKVVKIFNQGRTNIYLWGATYGDLPVNIDPEPRLIAPGIWYGLFLEGLEKQFLDHLRDGQEGFTTFHIFVATQDSKKYTIKGQFLCKVSNGGARVFTQTIGAFDGWANK